MYVCFLFLYRTPNHFVEGNLADVITNQKPTATKLGLIIEIKFYPAIEEVRKNAQVEKIEKKKKKEKNTKQIRR